MSAEHRAEAVAKTTDLGCIMNSACWCEFPGTIFTITELKDLFNAVAGYDWDIQKLMDAGARVWFIQRCLGHIWGATGADDRIGQRIMTCLLYTSDAADDLLCVDLGGRRIIK